MVSVKKILFKLRSAIALVVFLSCSLLGVARGIDPLNSTFFSLGYGGNIYKYPNADAWHHIDMQASISLGKWVFNAWGLRVNFVELHSTNTFGVPSFYESGDINFLLDPVQLFLPRMQERNLRGYVYFGVGAVHRKNNAKQTADNDFLGSMGIHIEQWLFSSFFVFGDVGLHLYPANFDGNTTMSRVWMASLGMTYKFNYNPFRRFSKSESQRLREDWYIGASMGGGAWLFSTEEKSVHPTAELDAFFGKHYSTVWESRGRLSVGYTPMKGQPFSYYNLNFDFMANLLNVFTEQRNRVWNVSPYMGIGVMDNLSDDNSFLFNFTGGLYIRRWLSINSDLFLDVRALAVPSRFSSAHSYIKATVSLGYVYNIGRNTCR